jgi:hypothetical protein
MSCLRNVYIKSSCHQDCKQLAHNSNFIETVYRKSIEADHKDDINAFLNYFKVAELWPLAEAKFALNNAIDERYSANENK